MIELWYLNTKNISEEKVKVLFKDLPDKMVNDISRFRNHEDRKLKLFGKLMVRKYYEDNSIKFKWRDFQATSVGKPYCNGGKPFNISHSGDYVTVAFSDQEVGNDIEKVVNFDIESVVGYLHPYEAEYIKHNSNSKNIFFKVWTRKEAYLKALGRGIIDDLNKENCLVDELARNGKWYLHSLSFISNYQIALCTQIPKCKIKIRELFHEEFFV